ncbi:MAG: glycerol-3-phosphate dehydrogenase/oxidase [Gemmatimonadales bacterium]
MATEGVDLLIIGAGITGAGIARDAAMRGIRTALVDKGDFGSGTSSRSSRLVHGGLRYLEHYHWRLVFEASRERRTLLRIAPHLVRPRSFLFPIHQGSRVSLPKLAAGLWLYDILALFRNVRRHEMLSKRALRRAEPSLKPRGLKGGARYYDAQCDDARLTLANVRDAHQHGAKVANYVQMDKLESADGQVRGARVTDLVTGEQHGVRALVVVNATGPWTDGIRATDGGGPVLRTSKGAHVVVPRHRIGNREALTITSPIDGRVMFIVPWGELSYIGTTETAADTDPDGVTAQAEDVVYLLRSANALFPEARLTERDVVATWAGIRPLIKPRGDGDPSAASREHRCLESPSGLISIVGGKLTTYRTMAAEVTDLVARRLHRVDGRPLPERAPTDREPLPGGEVHDVEVLVEEVVDSGYPRALAEHLVFAYGSETPAVLRLSEEDPGLREPIVPGHPAVKAELVHAMRREMAITLGDLLMRRTHLFYEVPGQAADQAAAVIELAAAEMGWDADRRSAELAAYLYEVERNNAFRDELSGSPVS